MVKNVNSNIASQFTGLEKQFEKRVRFDFTNVSRILTDKIDISREARAASRSNPGAEEEPEGLIDKMMSEFVDPVRIDRSDEADDSIASEARQRLAAMKIAMRIANGDNVPMEDHKFLAEYDAALYKAAMEASVVANNDDPKDYDSLVEELFAEGGARASGESCDGEAVTDGETADAANVPAESVDVYC